MSEEIDYAKPTHSEYRMADIIRDNDNSIDLSPFKTEYYVPHIQVLIGIGTDHYATLTMDKMAFKELEERTGCIFREVGYEG